VKEVVTHRVSSSIDDNVSLHVEETGSGPPLLFIHEFAGDHRSWEPQIRHFSSRYRCITYAARGYPPSSVPETVEEYSQQHAVQDAIDVVRALGLGSAHLVGLSMGGFCALHLALQAHELVASVVIGGVGYGALPDRRAGFQEECEAIARAFETEGASRVAPRYAVGPARVQFQNKDPVGHAEFAAMLAEHSSIGSALTMRGFQKGRPSLFDFAEELARMTVPLLVMVGDEDEGAIETSVALKRMIPTAGLVMFPKTGHTLNLEEPGLFNTTLDTFLTTVDAGSWEARDPRSVSTTTTGIT
jgi:pimeloyl-ACP methyl ester carboxylesterase